MAYMVKTEEVYTSKIRREKMKMNTKGVSPVIATILLIALTVAAVGIVAAILSGMGTPTAPPTASLTLRGHYYPRYGDNRKTSFQISHNSGDTIPDQDVYVAFRAKIGGRENALATEVKGTIDGMGSSSGPKITWTSGWAGTTDNNGLSAGGLGLACLIFNPGDMMAGTTWELVFNTTNGTTVTAGPTVVFDILELSVVHKSTGSVLFQNLTVTAPMVLA